MKKILVLLSVIISFGMIFMMIDYNKELSAEPYSEEILRFHCIANSDSVDDQRVKLEVRDRVLKEMTPKLSKVKTREESVKIIKDNMDLVENIAKKTLEENNKNYGVKGMIGDFEFPIKQYGSVVLPPGKYNAFRLVLGSGEGKNWWCVMFPPLCFIDITKGVTNKQTDKTLKSIMNNKKLKSYKNENSISLKFKSIELFKGISEKIKSLYKKIKF